MVTVSGNPNPTYITNLTNPTNPTTKYHSEFDNPNCITAKGGSFPHQYLHFTTSKSGKSSELVQCAISGPCLRMRHRPSA